MDTQLKSVMLYKKYSDKAVLPNRNFTFIKCTQFPKKLCFSVSKVYLTL